MASVTLRAGLRGRVAGAALLVAACARDPFVSVTTANTTPSGEWRIERQVDRVTGAPVSNAINGAILVPPPARLQLACFKEHATVVISFAFKIGSTRNAEVAYRFDDKPGHEPRVRIVDDHKTVLIDDPNEVAQFTSEMVAADGLYLRIRSLTAAGRTSAEFKVAGAPAATAAAYAGCPLTPGVHASASPAAVRDERADKED